MRLSLRDIRLGRKFAALALIAALLFAVPFAFYARDAAQRVRTSQQERAALAPAQALLRVIQLTQQHRGLFSGGLRQAREAKQAEADPAYAGVAALLDAADDGLGAQWAPVATEWSALTRAIAGGDLNVRDGFARHTALIQQELQLLAHITEKFGLAYDGDPLAHHLVAATFMQLPTVTEELGKARARGSAYLTAKELNPVEQGIVAAFGHAARIFVASSCGSLEKAIAADPALGAPLAGPMKQAAEESARAFALVDSEILRASAPTYETAAYFDAVTRAIDAQFALLAKSNAELERLFLQRVSQQEQDLAVALAGMVVLFIVFGALAWVIVRSITVPLHSAVQLAMQVADGDLTASVERTQRRDEIGQLQTALAEMTGSLRRLIGEVAHGARTVADTSGQIAQGNLDLSQRTEEQASTLEETASSMEELTSTVAQTADNARQASELAAAASQVARRGGEVVGDVVHTMGEIAAASRRIAEITGVIDGIAFQTNILALNAAVEAARAGQQGRGFAVVATEVRNLAQRSATAAKEIKDLIGASVAKVDAGTRLADGAGSTMQEIVASVQKASDLIAEIASASREQSSGIGQINIAITQMDQVVQQNASLVEEATAATAAMSDQSGALMRMVARFKLEAAAGYQSARYVVAAKVSPSSERLSATTA